MVKLAGSKAQYEMKDLQCQRETAHVSLMWRYQKGSHFLIFLSNGREGFVPDNDVMKRIEEGWEELLEAGERNFGVFHVFLVKEQAFSLEGKKFEIENRIINRFLPAKIQVLPCEESGGDMNVYEVSEENSCVYVPVHIGIHLRYKKIWFSRKKRCIFRVETMEGYEEGMLGYHVTENSPRFPLTMQCMGKKLEVVMPREALLEVAITPEYAALYEIEETVQ